MKWFYSYHKKHLQHFLLWICCCNTDIVLYHKWRECLLEMLCYMQGMLFLVYAEWAWITSIWFFSLRSCQRGKGGSFSVPAFCVYSRQENICQDSDSGLYSLQMRVKFQQENNFYVNEFNICQISGMTHMKPMLLLGHFSWMLT